MVSKRKCFEKIIKAGKISDEFFIEMD